MRGNDHGIQAELLSAFRGDRPDRGDHGRREQVGGLFCSEHLDEVPHGGGAGERDRVDLTVEQHAVDVLRASLRRFDRGVGGDVGHVGAGGAELLGEDFSGNLCPRQQESLSRRLRRAHGAPGGSLPIGIPPA